MNDWIWSQCSKEDLEELVKLGKSTKQIAEIYNVSYWSIYKKARSWNIEIPKYYVSHNKGKSKIKDQKIKKDRVIKVTEEKLTDLINKGYTCPEISNILHTDVSYIYRKCKQYNIEFNKSIIKKEIHSYVCPDCQKIFHESKFMPYCSSCGIKRKNIVEEVCYEANSDIAKKILELRSKCLSYLQISKILGCSKSTVSYYCNINTKYSNHERTKRYRSTWIGKLCHKLNEFRSRKKNNNKVRKMCQDWNKKFRTAVSGFRNRYKKKGNIVEEYTYIAALHHLKGPICECYLTGQKIDITKDDYQLDHIIPVSKGGDNSLENMGITIPIANQAKTDLTLEEYLDLCKQVLEHHGYIVTKS